MHRYNRYGAPAPYAHAPKKSSCSTGFAILVTTLILIAVAGAAITIWHFWPESDKAKQKKKAAQSTSDNSATAHGKTAKSVKRVESAQDGSDDSSSPRRSTPKRRRRRRKHRRGSYDSSYHSQPDQGCFGDFCSWLSTCGSQTKKSSKQQSRAVSEDSLNGAGDEDPGASHDAIGNIKRLRSNVSSMYSNKRVQQIFGSARDKILAKFRTLARSSSATTRLEAKKLQDSYTTFFGVLSRFFKSKKELPTYLVFYADGRDPIQGTPKDAMRDFTNRVVREPLKVTKLGVTMGFQGSKTKHSLGIQKSGSSVKISDISAYASGNPPAVKEGSWNS